MTNQIIDEISVLIRSLIRLECQKVGVTAVLQAVLILDLSTAEIVPIAYMSSRSDTCVTTALACITRTYIPVCNSRI